MLATSLSQVCGFIATMRSVPPRAPRWPASEMRTSYQVGRPWMLDGKMLRGATGTPMRSTARANSSLALAEIGLVAVLGKGNAIHRADVDTGVAFDAKRWGEDRLHVAVKAPVGFLDRELDVVAELDLGLDVAQRHLFVAQRHAVAAVGG